MAARDPKAVLDSLAHRDDVRVALTQLGAAHEFAGENARPERDHAVELAALLQAGSTTAALHWLVDAGHVDHYLATGRRLARAGRKALFADRSRFLFSPSGVAFAAEIAAQPNAKPVTAQAAPAIERPMWDERAFELWFGDALVKRISPLAFNQIALLVEFEKCQWRVVVKNPFSGPEDHHGDGPKRLRNTLQRLNGNQLAPRLRFHAANGNVRWEALEKPPSRAASRKRGAQSQRSPSAG